MSPNCAAISAISIESTTLTANASDSLYRISIEIIFKSLPISSFSNGKGILSSVLVTLFSIKSTIVLL